MLASFSNLSCRSGCPCGTGIARIIVPTLVLCRRKDIWNLKAMAHGLAGAILYIWNLEMTGLFNQVQGVEDDRRRM
jgi:hypothetical protein